jgi:hypothetical protein
MSGIYKFQVWLCIRNVYFNYVKNELTVFHYCQMFQLFLNAINPLPFVNVTLLGISISSENIK